MGRFPREVERFVVSGRAERCRLAILGHLVVKAGDPPVTQALIRSAAGVSMACAKAVCNAYNDNEMPDVLSSWTADVCDEDEGIGPRKALAASIDAAETDEDRQRCSQHIARLVVEGEIDDKAANAARAALAEARHGAKATRESADEDQRQRMILCTDEGWRLVRVYEGIVSDDRRKELLRHVVREARADLKDRPNEDLGADGPAAA